MKECKVCHKTLEQDDEPSPRWCTKWHPDTHHHCQEGMTV